MIFSKRTSFMPSDALKNIDTKEIELPDTVFIRNIETPVFEAICIRCIAKIPGVTTLEANILDNLLGRDNPEGAKGIFVAQDNKNHSLHVKVELNVEYGICIPVKAEEIQSKLVEELSDFTGLHVASVEVIFKYLIPKKNLENEMALHSKE